MVFPIDSKSPSTLPMRGGTLAVSFLDKEDLSLQKQNFLPLQSLFVEALCFPPAFSELLLIIHFPYGDRQVALPARMIQTVELGPQKGFLLQLLNGVESLTDQIDLFLKEPRYHEEELVLEEDDEEQSPVEEEQSMDRLTLHDKLRKLNVNERARLASRADKMTRSLLLRDVEPQVVMFMLKNPHLTRAEVVEISKSPRINYNIASMILANKTWSQNEEIRYNLAVNPKTPLPEALKLLPGLNLKRLREIAKNQGMRNRIKQTALRMVLERAT